MEHLQCEAITKIDDVQCSLWNTSILTRKLNFEVHTSIFLNYVIMFKILAMFALCSFFYAPIMFKIMLA